MDFRRLSLILGIALALAGAAQAASDGKAKKYFMPPPPKAPAAGQKVVKTAPATVQSAPTLRSSSSSLAVSSLTNSTSTLARGLSGLPQVGDAAPMCRGQCAQSRYTCLTVDDEVCDTQWARCVAGCGS